MGIYLNPGNEGFKEIINSNYVDKTNLISLINASIGSKNNLFCISRPRRFGKSYAAQMLCAYYDNSCDSHSLFESYKIATDDSYEKNINKYNVINIDVSGFVSFAVEKGISLQEVPKLITEAITRDVINTFPNLKERSTLTEYLLDLVEYTETKIVFIIDEWDSLIRESGGNKEVQARYLNLLRSWFKNTNFTSNAVAIAYMTGILPIKKDNSQSAISDFHEYSIIEPMGFAEYVGFTEDEVRHLCLVHNTDYNKMKQWYDGYTVGDCFSVYNPYSVMKALESGKFKSYWKRTSAINALLLYVDMDQEGLQDDIIRLIAGESIAVDVDSFQNDVDNFLCKDDVFTLLVHLGYLTYEESHNLLDEGNSIGLVKIPNEEVKSEFRGIVRKSKHKELMKLVKQSDQLLKETILGNSKFVASTIQNIHENEYAPTWYNNEQSLRYVIKIAYISCVDLYGKIEELPTGHGIADVVFIPKTKSKLPAMIIELKWNKTAESAIKQIKDNNYQKVVEQFTGDMLLVGISYDETTKEHSCSIEKYSVDKGYSLDKMDFDSF